MLPSSAGFTLEERMIDESIFNEGYLPFLLALLRVPGFGSRTIMQLCEYAGSPELVFKLPPAELESLGVDKNAIEFIASPHWYRVDEDIEWQANNNSHHILTPACENYPRLLREVVDFPPVIYARGQVTCLDSLQLGVVGTRKPTADGRRLARSFCRQLAEQGIAITSGLAIGIDTVAHQGALEAGGVTLAVMGHGLSEVYPRRNRKLAEQICDSGVLVSEFPLEYRPQPHNFPRRNRIISGMSRGVLVVEAARKSGSLITAQCAVDQGREVFAIPGAIYNPMARGCHSLIREGAKLVEQVVDIVEEIGLVSPVPEAGEIESTGRQPLIKGLDAEAKLLLDNIGNLPAHIDYLVETTGLPTDAVAVNLTKLELQGLIECMPGANYIRKPFET